MTQEKEDVEGSLQAAQILRERGIQIYSIGLRDSNTFIRLSTLPAISAITGGRFYYIDSYETMETVLRDFNFAGISRIEVQGVSIPFDITGQFTFDNESETSLQFKAVSDRGDAYKEITVTDFGISN